MRDEPSPERRDARIEAVIVATVESVPKNATHWSSRSTPKKAGCRSQACSASGGPLGCSFIGWRRSSSRPIPSLSKVRDVVGLYVSPPQHAVVLYVDEKSQIQALDRSQPMEGVRNDV
ncbi:hypothetical protein ACVJGD_007863 [Bradyrhizobium sp. USDA 10063]